MTVREIRRRVWGSLRQVLGQLEGHLKRWTQPDSDSLLLGTAADLTRSREELIAENAFLRQQVIVLKRQQPHPRLTRRDRALDLALLGEGKMKKVGHDQKLTQADENGLG